jgi:uncharacterized membrane protein
MYPHPEPSFHTADWWAFDRLVPILLMLVLAGLVVWAVLRLTRQQTIVPARAETGPGGRLTLTPDAALQLVRQRYARGELDRDAFLQISGDLSPGGVEAGATDDPPASTAP